MLFRIESFDRGLNIFDECMSLSYFSIHLNEYVAFEIAINVKI